MMTIAPDPTTIATSLADNVGGQLVDTVTGVAPVLVPFFLAIWAIRFVLGKFGLNRAHV